MLDSLIGGGKLALRDADDAAAASSCICLAKLSAECCKLGTSTIQFQNFTPSRGGFTASRMESGITGATVDPAVKSRLKTVITCTK